MATEKKRKRQRDQLTGIAVEGFKSLVDKCSLEIRPLTILAGANSSGKSSALQPILLMKQTLEASYDPGPLLIHGPNARFNQSDEMLARVAGEAPKDRFSATLEIDHNNKLSTTFKKIRGKGLKLMEMSYREDGEQFSIKDDLSSEEIARILPKGFKEFFEKEFEENGTNRKWKVNRWRCFFVLEPEGKSLPIFRVTPANNFNHHLVGLIHVPGLRGNPERTYKTTAVGRQFPGTFENYVASILSQWQEKNDENVAGLGHALETLGLTWKVTAQRIDDTRVEIRVGRLPRSRRGGARDLVNIADVGFGVSQSLPVVMALLVAREGQVVYLEQPEIHLHPCGQTALAKLLAQAATRGVRVIAETHSSLLLLAIQTLVARGDLDPKLVKLHWFERNEVGMTKVSSADLDEAGAFGEWPEDFDDVLLNAQSQYLDAAETALQGQCVR